MPSDFAHGSVISLDTIDIIRFGHDQCATRLPDGSYEGEVIQSPHALGNNGMGKSWRTVRIVGGDHDGEVVSIWGTNNAEAQ